MRQSENTSKHCVGKHSENTASVKRYVFYIGFDQPCNLFLTFFSISTFLWTKTQSENLSEKMRGGIIVGEAPKNQSENLSETVGKNMSQNSSHRSMNHFSDNLGSTPVFILPIWTQDFRKGNPAPWPSSLWINGSPITMDPHLFWLSGFWKDRTGWHCTEGLKRSI